MGDAAVADAPPAATIADAGIDASGDACARVLVPSVECTHPPVVAEGEAMYERLTAMVVTEIEEGLAKRAG